MRGARTPAGHRSQSPRSAFASRISLGPAAFKRRAIPRRRRATAHHRSRPAPPRPRPLQSTDRILEYAWLRRDPPLDRSGNMPPLPGIFPDYSAPIGRNGAEGRELVMARWGMPTPLKYLAGRRVDPGVTNIRQVGSAHWHPWLNTDHRCVVPFTSFSENEHLPDGSNPPVWFALDESRPLAFFCGPLDAMALAAQAEGGRGHHGPLRLPHDRGQRLVGAIHPKAMPVILTSEDDVERWLSAPVEEALRLQRPLPDDMLTIVARGEKEDRLLVGVDRG
jgi:putative SOS response-associated peptidase YedK